MWGGLSVLFSAPHDSDTMMKILLDAGTSSSFLWYTEKKISERKDKTRYIFIYHNKYVKKLSLILQTRGKSAMVHNNVLKNKRVRE